MPHRHFVGVSPWKQSWLFLATRLCPHHVSMFRQLFRPSTLWCYHCTSSLAAANFIHSPLCLVELLWPAKCTYKDGRTTSTCFPSHMTRDENVLHWCHQADSTRTPLLCVWCRLFSRSFCSTCFQVPAVSFPSAHSMSLLHLHTLPPAPPCTCILSRWCEYPYCGPNV